MDADGGWSSELAYAALAAITTEHIGQSGLYSEERAVLIISATCSLCERSN